MNESKKQASSENVTTDPYKEPEPKPRSERASFQISMPLATIIVGLMTLFGGVLGAAFTYFQVVKQAESNYKAKLQRIVTDAGTTLEKIKKETETQLKLQQDRFAHEKDMAQREFTSNVIFRVLESGTPEEQRRDLRAYAEIGLITGEIGSALLKLAPDKLPTRSKQEVSVLTLPRKKIVPRTDFDFSIQNDLLFDSGGQVDYLQSPNTRGELTDIRFVVVDFTVSVKYEGTVRWWLDPRSRRSAHILIDRLGNVVQLVPFSHLAWHAGRSKWKDLTGLNKYSIGIDLVNYGPLNIRDGKWMTLFRMSVADDQVIVAQHKHEDIQRGWHSYTEVQIKTLESILAALLKTYPTIEEIIGQEDISPGIQLGPGPALDMDALKRRVGNLNRNRISTKKPTRN